MTLVDFNEKAPAGRIADSAKMTAVSKDRPEKRGRDLFVDIILLSLNVQARFRITLSLTRALYFGVSESCALDQLKCYRKEPIGSNDNVTMEQWKKKIK